MPLNMSEIKFTRLSSKGQVVIPVELRELMGLEDGDTFAVYGDDDTVILKKLQMPSEQDFKRLLQWGEEFARRKGVSTDDGTRVIIEYKKGK